MWKVVILGMAALSLTGCGTVARQQARSDMEESKAAYEACLQQHPDDASACEALNKIYEADLKAYRSLNLGTGFFIWTE